MLFVRVASHPLSDLRRGYSYSMGAFGDEDQAHGGLSGYSCIDGLEEALERLDDRMGIVGYPCRMWVCVYEGGDRGVGPDREDLFAPSRLVCAIDTRAVDSADKMVELVCGAMRRSLVANRTVWIGKKG